MATIGQTLAAARAAAGHTIADLSTRTRIREPVLRGIEEEDFVPCGGDFYARGHIRSLCRTLGVEPQPLLEEYDREHAVRGHPSFVPQPRNPASGARASVRGGARTNGGDTETADSGTTEPRSFGEDSDPEAVSERWGHFERDQNLRGRVRMTKPRAMAKALLPRRGKEKEDGDNGYAPKHRGPSHADSEGDAATGGADDTAGAENTAKAEGGEEAAKPERSEPRPAVTRARTRRGEAVSRYWPWAVVGIIIVLALLVGIRAWNGEDTNPLRTALESVRGGEQVTDSSVLPEGTDEEEATVDQVAEEGSAPEPAAGAEERSAQGDGGAVEEAQGDTRSETTVGLTASGRSWVKVTDSAGQELFTGFLLEGEGRNYVTDDGVTLWLGDAGAITVSVDGQDIGPAGFSGEVREITVGAEGFGER